MLKFCKFLLELSSIMELECFVKQIKKMQMNHIDWKKEMKTKECKDIIKVVLSQK